MKKILFNDQFCLTDAVLEGRKTQTRRIVKPQPRYHEMLGINWKGFSYGIDLSNSIEGARKNFISGIEYTKDSNIPFHKGDVVAVAQRYGDIWNLSAEEVDIEEHQLPSGEVVSFSCKGITCKMYVKSELMPHQIEITDMRLQRLQDITDEECIAEGITPVIQHDEFGKEIVRGYVAHHKHGLHAYAMPDVRSAYALLMDMLSGKGTWESNPWVFAYTFKLIK